MPQVDFSLLQKPLFHVFGYSISILGLIAFAVLVASGLTIARVLQSAWAQLFLVARSIARVMSAKASLSHTMMLPM